MTPDQLAAVNAEHSHQRALFAWANVAERIGFALAWDERTYGKGAMEQFVEGGCNRHVTYPVPELRWLHAIPNGGYRDKITAGKLKAEGVKRGIPDVFLPLPMTKYAGLYVELKRPETHKAGTRKASIIDQAAGSTSELQDEAIAHLRSVGYAVSVCFAWDAAAREIQSYIEASRKNA
jgi:hypothetical protein